MNIIFGIRRRYIELVEKHRQDLISKNEEKKLFILTRCNTLVNRDLLDKREIYIKKAQKEYKEIYGEKTERLLKNINKITNDKPKKTQKVRFSGVVLYSN